MDDNAYIHELIAQGEHRQQDFKYQVTDAAKLAKSVSAFANTAGGRLLIGVRDDGVVAGVTSDEEIFMMNRAAYTFCSPESDISFRTFHVDGHNVVVATIPPATARPVCAMDAGGHATAYLRIKDENVVASPVHVEMWKQELREENVMPYTDTESHLMEMMRLNPRQPLQVISKMAHVKRFLVIKVLARLIRYGVAGWEWDGDDFLFYLK